MADIPVQWSRWIRASVYNTVTASLYSTLGADFSIQVEPEPDIDHDGQQQWIEVRMDGPDYDVYPSNEWGVKVEINVLISRLIGDDDIYAMERLKGAAHKALSGSITLKKWGDGEATLGCMRLTDLFTRDFGRVEAETPLQQATVEVRGYAEITV